MNKMDELKIVAAEDNPDIIALTESWTNESVEQCVLAIPDYHPPVRQDRLDTKDGRGGGVLLYVKSYITFVEIKPRTSFTNSVWIRITQGNKKKAIIGVVYRSPNSSIENNSNLRLVLEEMCNESDQSIIVGDFNYPSIDWELLSGDNSSDEFLEFTQDHFLTQHVQFPTRHRNTLDLVFTGEPDMCNAIKPVGYLGSSDHVLMNIQLNVRILVKESKQKIPDYGRANFGQMKKELRKPNIQDICKTSNLDEAWMKLELEIKGAIARNIPFKHRRSRNRPPLGRPLVRALRRKRKLWRKAQSSNEESCRVELKVSEKNLIRKSRQAKRNLEKSIAQNSKKNPKLYYQYVRSVLKTKAVVGPLVDAEGYEVDEDSRTADLLNTYFSSVFTIEDAGVIPVPDQVFVGEESDKLDSVSITRREICEKIDGLDRNKATGPDEISVRVLKEIAPVIDGTLTTLFNRMISETYVPRSWKDANITPIHKKGTRSYAGNYRPVSLTCQLSKLMESFLRDRIVAHLEKHQLLRPSQHGFRRKRSCVTNLLAFLDQVTECVDRGDAADVVYLDYQKAFDKVPHRRLLAKLEAHGISGKVLQWIKEWLNGRRQRVSLNGELSAWSNVSSGVPQGSVLGPVLFLIYVNDIDEGIRSTMYKFADDTKLVKEISSQNDVKELEEDLVKLENWSDKWQMTFNSSKCKVMHMGRNNPSSEYSIQGEAMAAVDQERDLGVIISKDLKPSKQCAEAVKKANRALGSIKRCFRYKTVDVIKDLYLSRVRPHLEFAIQAWSPQYEKDKKLLEGVQRRATKLVRELRDREYEDRLKEFGLTTLTDRRRRGDLIEVHKILTDEDYCNSHLFEISHNTHTRGHRKKLLKPHHRLNARRHFFADRVVDPWNALDDTVVAASDTNSFKRCYDRAQQKRGTIKPHREANVPGADNL